MNIKWSRFLIFGAPKTISIIVVLKKVYDVANMKLAVKNKKRSRMVNHAGNSSDKTVDGNFLANSGKQQAPKIDSKSWEITHQMNLLWRIIRHGYNAAFNQSDSVEEAFIKDRKNKTKEELLEEYYSLNKLLQSSL